MRVGYSSKMEGIDGTCLPVTDHLLELTFIEGGGVGWDISCPDSGCVQVDGPANGTCWVQDWFEAVEVDDLIYGNGLVVRFVLEEPENWVSEYDPVMTPVAVKSIEVDGQLSIPIPDEIFKVKMADGLVPYEGESFQ